MTRGAILRGRFGPTKRTEASKMTPDPTPPLGAAELDAIEAQANRATPGPWSEFCESSDWWIQQKDADGGPTGTAVADANGMSVDDMLFIVAARTNVPRLVAEVKASRARETALTAALRSYGRHQANCVPSRATPCTCGWHNWRDALAAPAAPAASPASEPQ
jgi:hypothetical protein